MKERQMNHCSPVILEPLIEKLIEVGMLPEPTGELTYHWPSLQAPNSVEMATTAKSVAEALNTYASGAAESIMPLPMFLKRYMNFTVEEIEDLEEALEAMPPPEDVPEPLPPVKTPGPLPPVTTPGPQPPKVEE